MIWKYGDSFFPLIIAQQQQQEKLVGGFKSSAEHDVEFYSVASEIK